jgi:hypothetical protein
MNRQNGHWEFANAVGFGGEVDAAFGAFNPRWFYLTRHGSYSTHLHAYNNTGDSYNSHGPRDSFLSGGRVIQPLLGIDAAVETGAASTQLRKSVAINQKTGVILIGASELNTAGAQVVRYDAENESSSVVSIDAVPSFTDDRSVVAVAYDPITNAFFAAAHHEGGAPAYIKVYRSLDDGLTWSPVEEITTDLYVKGLTVLLDGSLVLITADGSNFRAHYTPGVGDYNFVAGTNYVIGTANYKGYYEVLENSETGDIFVGYGVNNIRKSSDKGATFTTVSIAGIERARHMLETYHDGQHILLLSTPDTGSSTRGIYKSVDGGATWTKKTDSAYRGLAKSLDGTILSMSLSFYAISRDGGETWDSPAESPPSGSNLSTGQVVCYQARNEFYFPLADLNTGSPAPTTELYYLEHDAATVKGSPIKTDMVGGEYSVSISKNSDDLDDISLLNRRALALTKDDFGILVGNQFSKHESGAKPGYIFQDEDDKNRLSIRHPDGSVAPFYGREPVRELNAIDWVGWSGNTNQESSRVDVGTVAATRRRFSGLLFTSASTDSFFMALKVPFKWTHKKFRFRVNYINDTTVGSAATVGFTLGHRPLSVGADVEASSFSEVDITDSLPSFNAGFLRQTTWSLPVEADALITQNFDGYLDLRLTRDTGVASNLASDVYVLSVELEFL